MRGKKAATRRRRALGRLGVLALSAALCLLLVGYGLTPESVRQKCEIQWGMTGTEPLRDLGEIGLEDTGPIRGWLSGNDRWLLLWAAAHHWTAGWQPVGSMGLDCTGEEPLVGGAWLLSEGWRGGERCFLFGRVKDPAVVRVEAVAQIQDKTDDKPRTVRAQWLREGQEQDFCIEPGWRPWNIYSLELIGYDAGDRETVRTQGEWSIEPVSAPEIGGYP